jgi:hypothetical protein
MPDDTKEQDGHEASLHEASLNETEDRALSRRNILLGSSALVAAATMTSGALAQAQKATPAAPTAPSGGKPNILVIWGDDVGVANISAYSNGLMGYETPSIDRIGREGIKFLHYYGEQSCTAGRAAFLTGQHGIRSGAMDDVGAFVMSFKEFPPRSFPPTFVPANILEEMLDDMKEDRKKAGELQQRGIK